MEDKKTAVFRVEHFNAAHRLHNASLSAEENQLVFGKCNNPNYHGHNYTLIVKVTGVTDPITGYVIDLKILSDHIKTEVIERFDHKNLNLDTSEFKHLNPTAENIAKPDKNTSQNNNANKQNAMIKNPDTTIETPMRKDAFSQSDEEKIDKIALHFKGIMETLGLDLKDDSLNGTPRRVAKMYVNELFSGLNPLNKPDITLFENSYRYSEMLVEKGITFYSSCEHHFVPIFGKAHIAYISSGKVIGLSKLNRIVNYFSKRPQVQERLTMQIAKDLQNQLQTEDKGEKVDLEYYKEQLEAKEDMLLRTTAFLGDIQKKLEIKNNELKEKQRDILSSFDFAKIIQTSVQPDTSILKVFFKDACYEVLQQIAIGGDTIFVKNTNSGLFFGLLDATGHANGKALLLTKDGIVRKLQTSKTSIGQNQNVQLCSFELDYEKNGKLILFSDGLVDQFGGNNDKKYMTRQLSELLEKNHQKKTDELAETILQAHLSWKGTNDQTDDISYIIIEF
ncbi:putative GTP cyclohydrolase I [Ostertagia ostertagi]